MIFRMLTGKSLKAIRSMRGLTQLELAQKSGVGASAIATFETGQRQLRTDTAVKLIRALDVQVSYKIGDQVLTGP